MTGWRTAVPIGKAPGAMSKELLFDTGALLDIYKGRNRIKPYFDHYVKTGKLNYISVISEAELWRGLRTHEVDRHNVLLAQFIVLPLRSEAARLAGSWMQQHQAIGLGWMDALIVATAATANLVVLTRDKRLGDLLATQSAFELYE